MDPHLLLAAAEGCGPAMVRALLDGGDEPDALLAAAPAGLPPAVAARLADLPALRRRAAGWIDAARDLGLSVLTPATAHYPPRLVHAPLRPLVLFARGDLELLDDDRGIAIVGSRSPTVYGVAATRDFTAACAAAGLPIWSGLAIGVDTTAHETALARPAPTVAVLAGGLHAIYPAANAGLAARIAAADGVLLSEAPPGLRAGRGHFPRRNRILGAAPAAVLVTEAAAKSGSMHTAHFAAEAGTPVFAVPGAYTSAKSRGCHRLIAEGAQLAADPEDLLRALDVAARGIAAGDGHARARACSAAEQAVLRVVRVGPRPEDLVCRESGLPRSEFARAVLGLVQKQLVEVGAGGLLAARWG